MEPLPITPSHTVGPFFAYGLTARQYGYDFTSLIDGQLTGPALHRSEQIIITGTIFDGHGTPINDALIELWQADPQGHYQTEPIDYPAQPDAFVGVGRLGTGPTAGHRFSFTTLKPGATATDAPHINVILMMRGSLRTLYTRLYFSDETKANAEDPLLNSVSPSRRSTLIANQIETGLYQFDIWIQGEGETVFFDM